MNSYQVIVLSGGGAKGPYGLGVLLALNKFHQERKKDVTKIYCGSSVGALNSTLAAQGDLMQLKDLYARLRTQDVIGTRNSRVTRLGMLAALRRKPFHYFRNSALKSTIARYVRFDRLYNAHLLICSTNYSTGDLETFYTSRLIDAFVAEDAKHPPESRRLFNYHRLGSQEELVQALLASAAVPFYLPPVLIRTSLFVDGGVGNNTPLRQTAYICRFLNGKSDVLFEPTVCVINDPVRFKIGNHECGDVFGVIRRTMDIFHNELLTGSHVAWERINREMRRIQEQKSLLDSDIGQLHSLSHQEKATLRSRVGELLQPESTSTPRRELPLLVVQPKTPLVIKDLLSFDPPASKVLKEHGTADCLALFQDKNFITQNDCRRWSAEIE